MTQHDASQRRRLLADVTSGGWRFPCERVRLSNDVALAAVRKDAVALHRPRRKPVLAFALLALVVSCDWGSPNKWAELETTKLGKQLIVNLTVICCVIMN